MSSKSDDSRLQEHLVKLNVIVARRNEFLRELFRMMRSKQDINAAVEDDDDGLLAFLQRFDVEKDLVQGSISNVSDDVIEASFRTSLDPLRSSSAQPAGSRSSPPTRNTRKRSRVEELPHPSSFTLDKSQLTNRPSADASSRTPSRDLFSPNHIQSRKPSTGADSDDDHDELDLIGPKLGSVDVGSGFSKTVMEKLISGKVAALSSQDSAAAPLPMDKDTPSGILVEAKKDTPSTITDAGPVPKAVMIPAHLAPSAADVEMKGKLEDQTVDGLDSSKDEAMDMEEDEVAAITRAGDQELADDEPVLPKTIDAKMDGDVSVAEPVPNVVAPLQGQSTLTSPLPASYSPVKLPLPPSVHEPILIPAPASAADEKPYKLDLVPELSADKKLSSPNYDDQRRFNPNYTLPPLSVFPAEFTKKAKPRKRQKRDSDREKGRDRESKRDKDDGPPMGLTRWGATLSANPVWKKVSRASKCLSTREWGVAMAELRLIRTIERINTLKDEGRWSFRQPKKQRSVGGSVKSHWDYLMEEMKWMRIDFREERRWKMALAYNLSTAVLEWHFAKTAEERDRAGIVVKWRRPHVEEAEEDLPDTSAMDISQDESQLVADKPTHTLLGINYDSDEDEEDETEKEQPNVVDSLEPASVVQDVLDNSGEIQPKNEEVDDQAALQLMRMADATEPQPISNVDLKLEAGQALKSSSDNPVLTGSKSSSQSTNGDNEPTPAKNPKSALAPLRERIVYEDDLFLDVTSAAKATMKSETDESGAHDFHSTLDLTTLFPDLQPLNILELSAAPVLSIPEGKKKLEKKTWDRDDPTRRLEDTTYTKLYPTGKFMSSKPTLIGPLQPAKRFKDGQWLPIDPSPVLPDVESGSKPPEDSNNELFDGKPSNSSSGLPHHAPFFKDKDARRRGSADHLWSTADDLLLKQLVERYSTNWPLIAECYNSSRLTTPTERRTFVDCAERWKERWGSERKLQIADISTAPSNEDLSTPGNISSSPMTTRGVKRLASVSVSSAQGVPMGSEPKKRRRHALLQDSIKRAAKKRQEAMQKMLAANQRKPSAIHETHAQYNKLPKYTPLELARMKADRDQRDGHDMQLARKRQEEQMRQNLLRDQAQRNGGVPVPPAQVQAQLQQAQQQQGQQGQTQAPQAQAAQPAQQPQAQPQATAPQAPPTMTPQQFQQQQLAQLQQLQAQQQANQAARVNAAAAAASRPTRLAATTNGRPVTTAQAQAQLLQQARAMQIPLQLPPGAQANLVQQVLSQAQASGNAGAHATGNPYYSLPANLGNLTQEQLLNAFAMQTAAQQQHALQQQQQAQQATQGQQASNGFPNGQT